MSKGSALIIRHGALGDCVQASAVLKYLKQDYSVVDWLCSKYTYPLLEHNPKINRLLLYQNDSIPIDQLHQYYKFIGSDYDKSFVFSGSVEGKLVFPYPQEEYYWSLAKRRRHCNKNYIETQIEGCGYTPSGGDTGELYFGSDSIAFAKNIRTSLSKNWIIVCSLSGSTINKGYMLMQSVLEKVMDVIPESIVFLVGSQSEAVRLSWVHPRVINLGLRTQKVMDSFALTKYSDLVIGPDSAILSAAGCFDTPKICLLTHSSWKNVCSTWRNDFSLQAKCYCSPCFLLHRYTDFWRNVCPIDKYALVKYGKEIPSCVGMDGFPPQYVFDRIMTVYETRKDRK